MMRSATRSLTLPPGLANPRVGSAALFTHVILQSKHQSMTASNQEGPRKHSDTWWERQPYSHLMRMSHPVASDNDAIRIMGVLPMEASTLGISGGGLWVAGVVFFAAAVAKDSAPRKRADT
jgi:hypothetical protein